MAQQILVTGGTGFIGSHTAVELQQAGYEVVIVDDLSNSSIDVLDNIEKITGVRPHFEQFNLVDKDKTEQLFQDYPSIEAIIHFAASKAVGESVDIPLHYYRNNLVSLVNLLDCQRKYNLANLVFSSSCTVYGQPDVLPVTEQTPRKDAESPYGNTKRISEDIIQDSVSAYPEIKGIALRYFNPIGAHESALIGELPLGVPLNLVPFITQTAAGLRDELKVFGDDYDTPDGTCIRDYIHVCDLADAHVLAAGAIEPGRVKVYNLGNGEGFSVKEVIETCREVTGHEIPAEITPRRPGDPPRLIASSQKAIAELGWQPQFPDLKTIVSDAWRWHKRQ